MKNKNSKKGKATIEIKPHFYNGNILHNTPCNDCDKPADNHIHLRNGGIVCDNPNGPCSCGAWH